MKKMLVFAVVCAIAAMFTVSCVPLASTDSFEEKVDNNNLVDNDEEITDESENDSNVVTDESADELIDEEVADSDELVSDEVLTDELLSDEEETDSEVNDELVDDEETSDEDTVIPTKPEINVLKNFGGDLAQDSTASLFFYSSEIVVADLCVKYQITGASIGIDYGLAIESSCGPNTVKIVKGTSAVQMDITNLNKTTFDKNLTVVLVEEDGYEIGTNFSVSIKLLGKEEVVDIEEISDSDSVGTEVGSDIDSVEETEETSDEDSVIETEGEDSDDSEVSDEILTDEEPDETPDVDNNVVPTIQNPVVSESCKDKVILTELVPGNYIEGWNAGSSNRGFEYYNTTGITVWYRSVGFCAITSSMAMNAKGEGVTAGKHVENVRCVDHNIVSCN